MDWERTFELFIADKTASGLSRYTIRYYRECWTVFNRFWDGKQEIDRHLIRAYLCHVQEETGPITAATRWRGLKVFLRWCVSEELLPLDPTSKVKTPKQPQDKKQALSERELADLYRAATSARDRAILALMIDTGLRSREVRELRPQDVDLLGRRVTVTRGKGGKSRVVPLSPEAVKVVRRWMQQREAEAPVLFYAVKGDRFGEPLQQGGLNRILKRLGDKAGVKVHAHLLRHSFARSFIAADGNVAALQALLGHSSLDMTARYVRLNFSDLASQHAPRSPFAAVRRHDGGRGSL